MPDTHVLAERASQGQLAASDVGAALGVRRPPSLNAVHREKVGHPAFQGQTNHLVTRR